MLEILEVSKTFEARDRRVVALQDVSLSVQDGEFLSLLGPSGCGKTTLLRIIDGLTEATSGRIVFDGIELQGVSRDMAFVFQDINLLPWRSVVQNVWSWITFPYAPRL